MKSCKCLVSAVKQTKKIPREETHPLKQDFDVVLIYASPNSHWDGLLVAETHVQSSAHHLLHVAFIPLQCKAEKCYFRNTTLLKKDFIHINSALFS